VLAARSGATCTASAVVGDEIVVLSAIRGDGSSDGALTGARYPFAPPVGLMYVLWDTDAAFESWLARPATLPMSRNDAHLRAIRAECRDRGYLVEALTDVGARLHTLMAGVAAYDLPDKVRGIVGELVSTLGERVYLGAEMTARGRHPTHLLAAPTYGADGRQKLVLTLYVGEAITGAEIARLGRALMASAAAVTAAATTTGGAPPRGRKVSA
jgi:hypothetical protein